MIRPRVSAVGSLYVYNVSLGSTLLAGDAVLLAPRSRALAVQREIASFYGNEGRFDVYAAFTRPIPKPLITEPLHISIRHSDSPVRVADVNVSSISSASILQIGSNVRIDAEARVKHIRQLLRDDNGKDPDIPD